MSEEPTIDPIQEAAIRHAYGESLASIAKGQGMTVKALKTALQAREAQSGTIPKDAPLQGFDPDEESELF